MKGFFSLDLFGVEYVTLSVILLDLFRHSRLASFVLGPYVLSLMGLCLADLCEEFRICDDRI